MTIIEYLRHSVQRFPEKTAFIDERQALTYAQLYDAVRRIATGLLQRTTAVNQPIAVLIDRNVESVCASP